MIEIRNNGAISINRGDMCSAPLFINIGSEQQPKRFKISEYPGAKVEFCIINNEFQQLDNCVFLKIFTEKHVNSFGDIVVTLLPEETQNLFPGIYAYQIKIIFKDTIINTITSRLPFIVR